MDAPHYYGSILGGFTGHRLELSRSPSAQTRPKKEGGLLSRPVPDQGESLRKRLLIKCPCFSAMIAARVAYNNENLANSAMAHRPRKIGALQKFTLIHIYGYVQSD